MPTFSLKLLCPNSVFNGIVGLMHANACTQIEWTVNLKCKCNNDQSLQSTNLPLIQSVYMHFGLNKSAIFSLFLFYEFTALHSAQFVVLIMLLCVYLFASHTMFTFFFKLNDLHRYIDLNWFFERKFTHLSLSFQISN